MVRTEYKTISNAREQFDEMLNAHVVEGWEVMHFQAVQNEAFEGSILFVALLKRVTHEDTDRITSFRRTYV